MLRICPQICEEEIFPLYLILSLMVELVGEPGEVVANLLAHGDGDLLTGVLHNHPLHHHAPRHHYHHHQHGEGHCEAAVCLCCSYLSIVIA